MSVLLTVAEAEELLSTQYHVYTHNATGATCLRTRRGNFKIPEAVRQHVDVIGPIDRLPLLFKPSTPSDSVSAKRQRTTPSTLRDLYSIDATEGVPRSNSSQATANFLKQYYDPSDLKSFFRQFYPTASGRSPTVVGPNTPDLPGMESSLDIEYIMSIGGGVPTTWWSTAGAVGENEPFLKWMMDVAAAEHPPQLFSISYADFEDGVEADYAARVSVEFAKAGARGITIISGSGDGGVEGAQPRSCPGTSNGLLM